MRAARIFLPVLALLLCCAFVAPEERAPAASPKYFEIVIHIPNCKGNECFTEYIVLSNGTVMRKLGIFGEIKSPPIGMRQASPAATTALFSQVEAFFAGAPGAGNPGTAQDQLFLYDGEKYYAYNAFTPTPPEMEKIFRDTGAAFGLGSATDDFFLHSYYQPLKGGTKDLHVFADGTVISSMFVRQTSSIMYTAMSQLRDGDLEKIRALMGAAAGTTQKPYTRCPRVTELDYGFVEFQNSGAYARSFACGEAGNAFSPLLDFMRQNYGDAK